MTRNTYMEVYLNKIKSNTKKVIAKYNNYEYYIGVVKANAYGHGLKAVGATIDGGVNYLATATLDEATEIRKEYKDIPILCLGAIPKEYVKEAIDNNVTLTIISKDYLDEIKELLNENAKVHIKLNTGMNRLGISDEEELKAVYETLKKLNVNVEGIYSHIYEASNKDNTNKQFEKYKELIESIDYKSIKIRHLAASETIINYEKPDYLNGCRLGIIFYGFATDKDLGLESTFKLKSEIIQIHNLKKGETLGYNATYTAEGNVKIGVVPIGYADGITRNNKGRNVYINDKPYPIVGNICMDMLFVKIDDSVKVHDIVELYRDNEHVEEVADYTGTIPHEILALIGRRVKRLEL